MRTYYTSRVGKEITLAYWSSGDLIGGPYFWGTNRIHVWSARAIETSATLEVHGEDFRELARRAPEITDWVTDVLAFKLHWVSLLLQALGTGSVAARLAQLLLNLTDLYGVEHPDGVAIKYKFTQEDLANMVGATRQWVSTMLTDFQRQGILRVLQHQIVITDKARLQRIVA